ncbi:MAG: hypothetical protein A2921_00820 [Candidatus Magasanikbacteria bacterium RIFCSPLOWO2_01_FULL_43_20b]|uniref:DUF559 domain-containing protein n=1 Tax=Candidatus Magasanikbacteria bacterium RIFCSPLOWO2_12_FULL_43_12 TaxID=1798692 RepID=A0A1F6MVB7_9BACT|nr:MAG: hypothetical protein A3I93_00540 [Candidatus Magasanikbacteria bacterium RIFCSPLOWO2_02_FULL_43_22]OGH72821.1 MAG: hypothetical protein A2921_00820 [Candidatus Magasanikbacteria bacterium RIFCSPLOWO2_01_FULL_43_20b]OGH75617.1 MAG: hypothetical protein A3G00_03935 [Candidatus Magasanikbacteria bacterium RIFCSPLOWO2_12_FULL_43_12]
MPANKTTEPRDRNRPSDYLKRRRRSLRRDITDGEYALWQLLRNRELNYKFRRQVSIGGFVVDFYCHRLKLIIEVDGGIHNDQIEYDNRREAWLKKQGYNIMRVMNEDCIYNAETVLKVINTKIAELTHAR